MTRLPARPLPASSEEAAGIVLIRLTVLAALVGGLARTFADPDLWGHVRFGADILREGLTRTDPYSFTSDVAWVNHEWLAEVLMSLAWAGARGTGLVGLKMAIVIVVLALIIATLRADRVSPPVRDLLTAVALLALWPRVFVVRPQLFSILSFAALLWTLRRVEHGRIRWLWLLPLLLAGWVNLHGGWIVGFAALLVWATVRLIAGTTPVPARTLLACLFMGLAATLANPYGIELWSFLRHTVAMNRPNINDWRPLFESGAAVVLPWCLTTGVAATALWRGGRRVPIAHALIVIGLGVASIRVNRLDVFFTLSTVMMLAPQLVTRQLPRASPAWTTRMIGIAAALAMAVAAVGWTTHRTVTCVRLDGPWMPEREAAAALIEHAPKGRLLTWFDWGQYAIWHLSPGLKVSLDGRRETVYSDDFVARHLALYFEPAASGTLLADLRPDYAWIPSDLPLAATLVEQGWRRLFVGPRSTVFGHESSAWAAPTVTSPECFPGP